jgi:FkbM family methyltransferase
MFIPNPVRMFIFRHPILAKWYCTKKSISSFSLNSLDTQIKELFHYDNGYYVEIGANDGLTQSNTKYFEVFHSWRGILVEPHSPTYKLLRGSRSNKNWFYNCACVPFNYASQEVELIYSNLMTTSKNLETDLQSLENHIEESKLHIEPEKIHRFATKARTMNSLLIKSGAPRQIDFLSLDVEGAEISVLKGINHQQFRFKYILVECRDLEKMRKYLNLHHYTLERQLSHHDYLFRNIL